MRNHFLKKWLFSSNKYQQHNQRILAEQKAKSLGNKKAAHRVGVSVNDGELSV